MKKLALVAISAIVLGLSQAAHAQTFYRTTDSTIYGTGLTVGSKVTVNYPLLKTSSVKSGYCGEVVFKLTNLAETKIKVDGTELTLASLPQLLLPTCDSKTGTFAEARTVAFKTYDDKVVVVGKTPSTYYTVYSSQSRSLTANGCGFVTAAASSSYPQASSTVIGIGSGTEAAISTLMLKDAPICRTSNGISTAYYPAAWLTPKSKNASYFWAAFWPWLLS